MKTHLKMKIASLAAESQTIKREEKRWRDSARKMAERTRKYEAEKEKATKFALFQQNHENMRNSLYLHRICIVRPECRASLLAYGFLRGREYEEVENAALTSPDWVKVEFIVARFGLGDIRELKQKLAEWKDKAVELILARKIMKDRELLLYLNKKEAKRKLIVAE